MTFRDHDFQEFVEFFAVGWEAILWDLRDVKGEFSDGKEFLPEVAEKEFCKYNKKKLLSKNTNV